MSLFDTIFKRGKKKAAQTAARASPQSTTSMRLGNTFMPHWLRSDYTLRNSELIFSAVSRISNALSAMPIRLYKGSTPIESDLSDLVSFQPNPNMASSQFFKTMEACRDTEGNTYALKIVDENNLLLRLDVLDPLRVKPIMEIESGELWYRITPENGREYYIHNFYMIHVPFISTNGYSGVNPVSVLFDTIGYSEDIQKFSASQLQKGVNAQIVVEAPGNLGEEQRRETIQALTDTYRDTGGNILLLESGLKANTLNMSPVDTKLFEVERITRSKVAMVYNIPPHLLGDYSDTSFSSQEQQMLEFLMLTMLPIVVAYESELNRKLLTREQRMQGMHFKFFMDAILRADAKTRAEVHQTAVRGGFERPNEARADYGRASDPSGDELLVSRDLTTLKYLVQNPDKSPTNNSQGGSS